MLESEIRVRYKRFIQNKKVNMLR